MYPYVRPNAFVYMYEYMFTINLILFTDQYNCFMEAAVEVVTEDEDEVLVVLVVVDTIVAAGVVTVVVVVDVMGVVDDDIVVDLMSTT